MVREREEAGHPLTASLRQAADDPALENDEDQHDGQRGEHDTRAERAPFLPELVGDEPEEADRERVLVRAPGAAATR